MKGKSHSQKNIFFPGFVFTDPYKTDFSKNQIFVVKQNTDLGKKLNKYNKI